MSDLYSYLDVSGPEYAYLGHFRASEILECGHNTSGNPADYEQTIAAGEIPDIKTGRNYSADAEPSNISSEDRAGMTPPPDPMPTTGSMGAQKSSIAGPAVEGGLKSAAAGGLKSLFGIP